jgi:hypothetical protein
MLKILDYTVIFFVFAFFISFLLLFVALRLLFGLFFVSSDLWLVLCLGFLDSGFFFRASYYWLERMKKLF